MRISYVRKSMRLTPGMYEPRPRPATYRCQALCLSSLCTSALLLFCPLESAAQTKDDCGQLDGPTASRVIHMAARIFHTDPEVPSMDEQKLVPGTCYWRLSFSVPHSDHHWDLYLSPDKRFLTGS